MTEPGRQPMRRPELRAGVLHADLRIIGAGSAGLSVAAGAVQIGASGGYDTPGRIGARMRRLVGLIQRVLP
jgi:hypothetical protein